MSLKELNEKIVEIKCFISNAKDDMHMDDYPESFKILNEGLTKLRLEYCKEVGV